MKKILFVGAFLATALALIAFLITEQFFDRTQLPSGQYGIGIASEHLGACELMVNIFYPTNATTHALHHYPEKYRAEWVRFRAHRSIIPQKIWRRIIDQLPSFADEHAQLLESADKIPVIIFLPGIGGDGFYRTYLEDLASHGYAVIEIQPPHDVPIVVFDGGRVAELDSQFELAMNTGNREQIYEYRTGAHYRWLEYINCVINWLESVSKNQESPFFGKLDLERIGLLGHSHGGGVVTDYCSKNNRCKAGVNMDGWTKTTNSTRGFSVPFMFIENEHGAHEQLSELYRNMPEGTERFLIPGAGHMAFSDYILAKKPFAYLFDGARGDAQKISETTKKYLVQFFDRNIKNSLEK